MSNNIHNMARTRTSAGNHFVSCSCGWSHLEPHEMGNTLKRKETEDRILAAIGEHDRNVESGNVWKVGTPDHKPDNTGLDDGPYLPGRAPRKKPAPKFPEELRQIRLRAWETRRKKDKLNAIYHGDIDGDCDL